MPTTNTKINHVSDTALWVAYYRAQESKKSNALFKDPLAELLIGDRGEEIALDMKKLGRYTTFNVVMRTVIIDDFIKEAIEQGIDMVINLGAGMDTRPYRLQLPGNLRWIEVDHEQLIGQKTELLKDEVPVVELSRFGLDLANGLKRKDFFQRCADQSKNILVLTEGVIPYLSKTQVAELTEELSSYPSFKFWIAEYIDPRIYPHLRSSGRAAKMRNAPFQFFPDNWMKFFEEKSWIPKEIRYYAIEGEKKGRMMPYPWWVFLFRILAPKKAIENSKRLAGFMLLKRDC